MTGTVNISRDLWEDPAFADEPFTEREAWIWMIAEASWKDRERRVGKAVVMTHRGQLAGSVRFMAEAWKWSKSRVHRFLERLKNRDMIGTDSGTAVLVITICNYDKYQFGRDRSGTDVEPQAGQKRDRSGTNEKKDKQGEAVNRVDPDGSTPPVSPTLPGDEIEAASKPERPPPKMFLPSGWVLDDDGWTYARQHNLLDHEIQEIADGFRGYWTERRDKKAKRTEDGWRRTWQGHIRRSAPEYARNRRATGPSQAGGHRQPASIASIAARRRAERQDQDDLPERWRIA